MSPGHDTEKRMNFNRYIEKDLTIGTSPAGVVWTAYAYTHTLKDIRRMIIALRKMGGEIEFSAYRLAYLSTIWGQR